MDKLGNALASRGRHSPWSKLEGQLLDATLYAPPDSDLMDNIAPVVEPWVWMDLWAAQEIVYRG